MSLKKKLNVNVLRKPMEATHASGVHHTYEWRVAQIKALRLVMTEHVSEWCDAVYKDIGKNKTETEMAEILVVTNEINYILQNLKSWMAPQHVPGPSYSVVGYNTVHAKPLNSPGVLVIGPFNYPIQLVMLPVVGSLAGGNPTVIKPSELCPTVSALLAKLIPQYLEPGAVQVVEGSVPEVTELLRYEWGTVMFTGSERVGRIVASATALTLTPTILELGGKSPVLVDETAPDDMVGVANRIIWGKTFNAGQTCIATDYVVCHEMHANALCKELVKSIERQFGTNPRESGLGRIVTPAHAQRQIDMIQEVEGSATILCGGSALCDADDRYVCPTVVLNPPRECRLLQEEIFGPILPVIIVQSREQAIEFINERYGTPLALYVFTKSDKVYQEITKACPSGGGCRNDIILHAGNSYMPLGGLGTSGYGKYHGKYSFDTFTHAFASLYRPCFPGSDFNMIRYHPFTGWKRHALLNYVAGLPYIPVLHTRKVALVLGLMLGITYMPAYVPALDPFVKGGWQALGNALQAMANWALS